MDKSSPILVQVGDLTAWFLNGSLRYVRIDGHEVIRALFPTCRDLQWGTVSPKIENLSTCVDADHTSLNYHVDFSQGEISILARIQIDLRRERGRFLINFSFDATSFRVSQINRCGLCILHPPASADGSLWKVQQSSGDNQSRPVNLNISPDVLFSDIRSLCHQVNGYTVRFDFSGEEFETEDQRNWCDASIKTYCRPLSRPRPYTIQCDQRIKQHCLIGIDTSLINQSYHLPVSSVPVFRRPARRPLIGIRVNSFLGKEDLQILRELSPDFVRYDWTPHDPGWMSYLSSLSMPVELCLHVDDIGQLPEARQLPRNVIRLFAFRNRLPVSDESLIRAVRDRYPDQRIGMGTTGNFAELNRNRPERCGIWSAITYPICMQIHATDDWSLMENLSAIKDGVRTARSFAGNQWLTVGPVVLHRQPDPFAAGNDGNPMPAVLEPRMYSPFVACWVVGVIANLLLEPPDAAVLFDLKGENGLVRQERRLSPAFDVLKNFFAWRDKQLVVLDVPETPFHFTGFSVEGGPMWVANTGFLPMNLSETGLADDVIPPHTAIFIDRG